MQNVMMLNIDYSIQGIKDFIHPVVLKDEKNVVLVDCGYIGSLGLIEEELEKNNVKLESLTHVVLTHHDHDHMGTAAELKQKYPNIKIVASADETPYIDGFKKSPRLSQAENLQQYLPADQKAFGEKFCAVLRSVKPVNVDIKVKDGDVLEWLGGCEIVSTKGHTSGHISLLIKKEYMLIAGDAATIENNELVIANPQFTLDIENAQTSLQKIKNIGQDKIICYHGGIYKELPNG